MNRVIRQVKETIIPVQGNRHGPLPRYFVLWTVVTGLVDAYSYLVLGRVFVANMTGNVVFLGFALGGAEGFTWWASILAIVAFMAGAFIGGVIQRSKYGKHRAQFLATAMVTQGALVVSSIFSSLILASQVHFVGLVVTIVFLSLSMGVQNATARAIAVPDLTTTVLTLTITGLAGDGSGEAGKEHNIGRRLVSIFSMAFGAFIGAMFVRYEVSIGALIVAGVLLAIILWRSLAHASDTADWVTP
ncbi:YoaK family protein [Arcanobacterium pinnipediorum]|uniref:DUF1275 domain-containing protein n=1 Tax=Arcanobacterium pinnipediorum TaxID=1503041 RepID=A0ABY5AIL0_9ACTO|nr:YoaK family protein [Arcanobacterium pinnipediorum]USR79768.1 DUF1275 domain-containing protein [Arcanobacterium pinnipediorum]